MLDRDANAWIRLARHEPDEMLVRQHRDAFDALCLEQRSQPPLRHPQFNAPSRPAKSCFLRIVRVAPASTSSRTREWPSTHHEQIGNQIRDARREHVGDPDIAGNRRFDIRFDAVARSPTSAPGTSPCSSRLTGIYR